jgi:putative addiction module component (TIGR02574 family)
MPKPVAIPPPGCDELTVEEQIDYVQSLWERIAATPDQVPVPDWHREVLDERLKDYDANPDAGESWDVVRDRLATTCASASHDRALVDRHRRIQSLRHQLRRSDRSSAARQRRCRLANATPDPDFRYFSKSMARRSSANSMATTISQGVALAVCVQRPEL